MKPEATTTPREKMYSAPKLKRYGDIYELTGTVGLTGSLDNVTGLTRTGLPLIPADRHHRFHPKT